MAIDMHERLTNLTPEETAQLHPDQLVKQLIDLTKHFHQAERYIFAGRALDLLYAVSKKRFDEYVHSKRKRPLPQFPFRFGLQLVGRAERERCLHAPMRWLVDENQHIKDWKPFGLCHIPNHEERGKLIDQVRKNNL